MKQISLDPKILRGKPVIKGTRIPVYLILNLLARGYTTDRILEAYPKLTASDIRAALDFAQQRAKYEEELVPKVVMR